MGTQSPYRCGALFGFVYEFTGPGDGLGMHQHEPELQHNIIVLDGKVCVYGEGWCRTLVAGDIFEPGALAHEVQAWERSRILNLFTNGMPSQYRDLPESEFYSGTTRPPTLPLPT